MKTPFEQALLDAILEEYSDIPSDEEVIDLELSADFVRRSELLIHKTQRKTWYYINTGLKRVLLVALIAALLATTVFAIPAVREKLLKFFAQNEGGYYSYTFDPEQAANVPHCIETAYYPTYVPDGYVLQFNVTSVAGVGVAWENPDELVIFYTQDFIPEDPQYYHESGGINADGNTLTSIVLNGYEVIRGEDDEAIYYVWTNHEYLFTLICDKGLAEEEIVKIFESVQIDPNAEISGAES